MCSRFIPVYCKYDWQYEMQLNLYACRMGNMYKCNNQEVDEHMYKQTVSSRHRFAIGIINALLIEIAVGAMFYAIYIAYNILH